ncbi:putative threonine--tRNA ligase [Lupinus albus]|uniref:Putative threonine--tRNA ligase n=1 Tax=Lupinus albus TaxID=3870 RepID=A0A6A4QHK9_LUPAL|nr:putative threonine--tRNA ligase [Lupinus albus]
MDLNAYNIERGTEFELPLQFADFGVLHRNEASGALSGLTRVRRFQQVNLSPMPSTLGQQNEYRAKGDMAFFFFNLLCFQFFFAGCGYQTRYHIHILLWNTEDDAHIFCRESQIKGEMRNALNFINYVYDIFGFTYELKLSTKVYYNRAPIVQKLGRRLKMLLEKLKMSLENLGRSGLNEGMLNEGMIISFFLVRNVFVASLGPKIDTSVSDVLNRKFQCATLQLDFQLPEHFKSGFSAEDELKTEKPVMIHRAILRSVECMFAILLEHY